RGRTARGYLPLGRIEDRGSRMEDRKRGPSSGPPRSQTPVWERTPPKLRFGPRRVGGAKRSFARMRSQTGVWERGGRSSSNLHPESSERGLHRDGGKLPLACRGGGGGGGLPDGFGQQQPVAQDAADRGARELRADGGRERVLPGALHPLARAGRPVVEAE